MKKIKLLIADSSYLTRLGFQTMLKFNEEFDLAGEAVKAEELAEMLFDHKPQVLVIDYACANFCVDDIAVIRENFPSVNILAITYPQTKAGFSLAMEKGVTSHLLKDCGEDEIMEAIRLTAKKQPFLCGKIVEAIAKENNSSSSIGISCEGIKLSVREIQIIKLIADGLVNKQIAEKLFLSNHTINTHRKNIMNKLKVNNTAGLVMFAIKQNLVQPAAN